MNNTQKQVAQALLEIGAVGFNPDEPIRFKSGILSPVYVDNRRLAFHPAQWHVVIDGFQEMINEQAPQFDVIAGVAVGGVPHSSALAYQINKPSVFVRKESKGHGMRKLVEGGDVRGKRVLLIEDLVTTGGSSLKGVDALRVEGAIVDDMLAIVAYGFDEAQANFDVANVRLQTLTNFGVITQIAVEMGKLDEKQETVVNDWFNDPHGWESRR
jgi:orotate phosphoribosyltransferase